MHFHFYATMISGRKDMDKNITIRPVKPEDAEQFVLLENLIYRKTYEKILSSEVILRKEEQTSNRVLMFSDTHKNDKENICYVVEIDGNLVGYFWGKLHSSYEYYNSKGYADLIALYIHPDYQGLGIASKLKQIFIDWAKINGVTKFVIGVLKDNNKARKVYEKWGGVLDNYTSEYKGCDEVFYTYNLEKEQ